MSKPAQINNSLVNGIEVLLATIDAGEPVGVRELARRLGLETTRAQRLLATLAHLGLLQQDEQRRYQPGPGLPVLSAMAQSQQHVLPAALPAMQAFTDSEKSLCALGTLWRDRVTYLAVTQVPDSLNSDDIPLGPHPTLDARRSSLGILLSAWKGDDYHQQHDLEAVKELSLKSRDQGYCFIKQDKGESSIAIPLSWPGEPYPYLALGSSGVFNEKEAVKHKLPALREVAQSIVGRLTSAQ